MVSPSSAEKARFSWQYPDILLYVLSVGLPLSFAAYALVQHPWIAAGRCILGHACFAMAWDLSPEDRGSLRHSPYRGVSFTINPIAAAFLPVLLGVVWIVSPETVFLAGAAMACVSLLLARLVPAE
jgi:hypothetical protein